MFKFVVVDVFAVDAVQLDLLLLLPRVPLVQSTGNPHPRPPENLQDGSRKIKKIASRLLPCLVFFCFWRFKIKLNKF